MKRKRFGRANSKLPLEVFFFAPSGAREQAEARIAAQLPIDEKRALADHVIDNGGARTDTERQVRELFAALCGDAAIGAAR